MDYEAKQKRRRDNLAAVIRPDKRGAIAEFARLNDIDATLISQLLNGRTFTEKQARDIESKANLPVGYLDQETQEAPEAGSLEEIEYVFSRASWMGEDTKNYLLGLIKVMHDKRPEPDKR